MNPVLAFTIVMLVWTISDLISKKTKALVSMMLAASLIFLVGFATDIFPSDLIYSSGFLNLGNAVVGLIIVHLGTMMSLDNLKSQWKTFLIGALTVIVSSVVIMFVSELIFDRNVAVAGTAAITGGTLSILMVQEVAAKITDAGDVAGGMMNGALLAVFPLLILSVKNMVGFLVSASIIKREARRVKEEYRNGNIKLEEATSTADTQEEKLRVPEFLQTPYGTLFMLGLTVLISVQISGLTGGHLNTFVIALILGILLRHFRILKPSALSATDSFGLLMISIMVLAFGPLSNISPAQLLDLIGPIAFFLVSTIAVIFLVSFIVGKRLGYSGPMSIAVGMTSFFGFPGTMVLTQEAARTVGETDEEIAVIEQNILPTMITAGFATVTITSVIVGGILVGFMNIS